MLHHTGLTEPHGTRTTTLTVDGPALVLPLYLPVAQLALPRLVTRPE